MAAEEHKIIDLQSVIGVYSICNTGAVLVYQIDYGKDMVLAGMNSQEPEWCEITEEIVDGEWETGFRLGSFFIPFAEVMRFYGGA